MPAIILISLTVGSLSFQDYKILYKKSLRNSMQWNAEEADIFATLVSSLEPRAQEIDSVRGMMYGVQS